VFGRVDALLAGQRNQFPVACLRLVLRREPLVILGTRFGGKGPGGMSLSSCIAARRSEASARSPLASSRERSASCCSW
jgi:hypothetical protein